MDAPWIVIDVEAIVEDMANTQPLYVDPEVDNDYPYDFFSLVSLHPSLPLLYTLAILRYLLLLLLLLLLPSAPTLVVLVIPRTFTLGTCVYNYIYI